MKKYVFESLKFFCAAILCTILSAFTTPSFANCNLFDPSTVLSASFAMQGDGTVSNTRTDTRTSFRIQTNITANGTNSVLFYGDLESPGNYVKTFTIPEGTTSFSIKHNGTTQDLFLWSTNASVLAPGTYTLSFDILSSNPSVVGGLQLKNIQLERGDTATAYTPYNPLCATCNGTIVNYTSATGTVSRSGTPTPTNPIEPTFYKQGNMILRKVGDYADSYDATTGKIIRRVGVAVLDGTEDWRAHNSIAGWFQLPEPLVYGDIAPALCTHYPYSSSQGGAGVYFSTGRSNPQTNRIIIADDINFPRTGMLAEFKQYLANQYANGTPVTIYYPLATEVEEDWPASYCETPIKIATTKYNETKFLPLNTALANAISVVDTVVSNTITQAGRIATLQAQKQTRPADDTCPAYKQCLLVEDENGTPHWYEITDPFRDFVAPIIANNVAPASTTNDAGYTQLEYIDVQQYAKIELPHQNLTNNFDVEFQVQWPENPTTYEPLLVTMKNDNAWFGGYNSNRMALRGYSGTDYVLISKPESGRVVTINFRANNNSTSIYYNGVLQGTGPVSTLISTPDVKTFMFSDNVAASSGNNFTGRFYYMKINGNLYVPVKRNSDGAIGVYDTVSKMFFGNKGTGTFTAGPNVANTDVSANGTWTATWAANATTGVSAGTITGEALCNAVAGTELSIVTQEQISSSGWSNNGANCWCRVTSVSNNDGGYSVTNSNWVYYSSSAACTSGCAGYCDYGIRVYPAFRQNLFSM